MLRDYCNENEYINGVIENFSLLPVTTVALSLLLLLFITIIMRGSGNSAKKSTKYHSANSTNYGYLATLKALSSKEMPSFIFKCFKESGSIFRLTTVFAPMYPSQVVISGDLDLCRQVLNDKTCVKSKGIKYFKFLHDGGDDIFTSDGPFWKHSRKGIAPAFSNSHIKRMNEVVDRKIDELTKKLDILAQSGESFDVGAEMIDLTLSVISDAAFEYPLSIEEKNSYLKETEIAINEVRLLRSIPLRARLGKFIPKVRRARRSVQSLMEMGTKILESYHQLKSPMKGTVIDLIVNNENYKSDKERVSDIMTLFFGGHDTTGYTLAWILIELAKNQEEQLKLQKELNSTAVDKRTSSVGLNNVIKEGMRLTTVAPMGSVRALTHDLVVNANEKNGLENDILIPKDSVVVCSQMLLNHNPKYHNDPGVFKPSRWLDPSEEALLSCMPFSLGRRNCVGQSLAKVEIANVLSRLCANYTFTVEDEGDFNMSITYHPVGARLLVSKAKM